MPNSELFLATSAAACGVKAQLAEAGRGAGAELAAHSASGSADSSIIRRDDGGSDGSRRGLETAFSCSVRCQRPMQFHAQKHALIGYWQHARVPGT